MIRSNRNRNARVRALLLSLVLGASAEAAEVPGTNGRWSIAQPERLGDAKIGQHLGRQALFLRNNTHVVAAGDDFIDGTIEFDFAPLPRGRFFAIDFRYQGFAAYENVYLRPFNSGEFDALQYAPRIKGSSWQIYPEFNRMAELPVGQWTHLRLEVRGGELDVYVGDSDKATLHVPRLRAEVDKGGVVVWARVNDEPKEWAAAISNFRVTNRAPVREKPAVAPPPEGFITNWQVAEQVRDADDESLELPELSGWRPAEVEESGVVNLLRYLERSRGRKSAYVKTVLEGTGRAKLLHLGFSDDAKVFLNSRPLYRGRNAWQSRYPGYLGQLDPEMETIVLYLEPGPNELVIEVTDDQLFGWGVSARLSDAGP